MNRAPENFEVRPNYSYYRPTGQVSLEQATQLMTRALEYALAQNIKKLLVNATDLAMPIPTLPDRFFAVREWAQVAGGRVRLSVVLSPEIIDPEKFGVLVARNAGLMANIFTSEPEALEWLLSNRE